MMWLRGVPGVMQGEGAGFGNDEQAYAVMRQGLCLAFCGMVHILLLRPVWFEHASACGAACVYRLQSQQAWITSEQS